MTLMNYLKESLSKTVKFLCLGLNYQLHICFNFQDEEDIKAIARLFADMGDAYVELIATGRYFLLL